MEIAIDAGKRRSISYGAGRGVIDEGYALTTKECYQEIVSLTS